MSCIFLPIVKEKTKKFERPEFSSTKSQKNCSLIFTKKVDGRPTKKMATSSGLWVVDGGKSRKFFFSFTNANRRCSRVRR